MSIIICKECGQKIGAKSKICPNCGCPINKKKKCSTIVGIISIFLGIFFLIKAFSVFEDIVDSVNYDTQYNERTTAVNYVEDKENFINSCKLYNYNDIARNPNNYKNQNVIFVGQVIQVVEGVLGEVDYRIAVTEDTLGYYDDIIYCTYTYSTGESKILEDDIVTLYGICEGDYTYTSVLGGRITIPKVRIKYIELGDKAIEEEMNNKITLEKFNQIQTGMTYNEVVSIIGEEGELTSDVDLNMGSQYVTKSYDWEGKTGTASITFQGGKVSMKYQYGLK